MGKLASSIELAPGNSKPKEKQTKKNKTKQQKIQSLWKKRHQMRTAFRMVNIKESLSKNIYYKIYS